MNTAATARELGGTYYSNETSAAASSEFSLFLGTALNHWRAIDTVARAIVPHHNPNWVGAALKELASVDREAKAEGYGVIAPVAKKHARRIIEALKGESLPEPAVYPTEDREVAIMFTSKPSGAAVLILCDSDGGGACFSSIDDVNDRARFTDASKMPQAFVLGELRALEHYEIQRQSG